MSTNNKKTVRMAPIIEKESDTDVQQDDPEVQHQGDEEETTDHQNYDKNEDNPIIRQIYSRNVQVVHQH